MVHRALIVDDSRSARTLLKRLLENFGLAVETVESAEQALTWLQQDRPDVIFMDHLMPGMDGFAAVKVIKSDPQTANIPVLMYTSQEGALYLSQARALGAMGVLPKTLKSADVADVLQQLNMLKANAASAPTVDRPVSDKPLVDKVVAQSPVAAPSARVEPVMSTPMSTAAKPGDPQQLAHRIAVELRTELPLLGSDLHGELLIWRRVAIGMGAVLVLTLAAVLSLQYQLHQALQTVPGQTTSKAPAPSTVPTAAPKPAAAAPVATTLSSLVATEPVAYGEVPLSGARLERLRTLVTQQRAKRTTAVIQIQVFQADFCLYAMGNMYQLAPEDWPITRCELVGNPFGDALSVQQRQSVSFANFVGSVNAGQGNVVIDLQDGGRGTVAPYPERTDTLTAGEWNAVALRNQRVEFLLLTSR